MEGDQWNKKLWNRIANNTISWLPNAPEPPYLWLSFIGRSDWPKGYWMYHRKTIYLDVQFADEGELVLSREGQQHIIPSGAMAIIPPGEYRIETKSGCRKRHFGISGIILNNNLAAMNLNQVSILPDFRNPEFEELYQSLFFMTVEKDPEKALGIRLTRAMALEAKYTYSLNLNNLTLKLPGELQKMKINVENFAVSGGKIRISLRFRQKNAMARLQEMMNSLEGFTIEDIN